MIKSSVRFFLNHPLAANLLMFIMFLSGFFAIGLLNTQHLPSFDTYAITVQVRWPGANAEEVAKAITTPIEDSLRDIEQVKEINGLAKNAFTDISLQFKSGADMSKALERVKQRVNNVRDLPSAAEKPVIEEIEFYSKTAWLVLTTHGSLNELRPLAKRVEADLLTRGISKINLLGLPKEEIQIQIPEQRLSQLKLSLNDIAKRINARSQDMPIATVGKGQVGRELRVLAQAYSLKEFANLPIQHERGGQLIRLGDIASHIKRVPRDDESLVYYQNQPAVVFVLNRSKNGDSLENARILHDYLAFMKNKLPHGIQLLAMHESWQHIKDRINLMLENGLLGLILILIILFLFLHNRIAFWVAMGIPASFLASLQIFYFFNGSLNMVSLFALIMALGIIVDDSIVVGEEVLSQLQNGIAPLKAAEIACLKMLPAISASSLTTIAAFIPLLMIKNTIGDILRDIPIIIVCVILVSLLECLLVLPGHLQQSFKAIMAKGDSPTDKRYLAPLKHKFEYFREQKFKPLLTTAIQAPRRALGITMLFSIIVVLLLSQGFIHFTFFPDPDGSQIRANIKFRSGTTAQTKAEFLQHLQQSLAKTNRELSADEPSIVLNSLVIKHEANLFRDWTQRGEDYASVLVELRAPDEIDVSNQAFIQQWRHNTKLTPAIEDYVISRRRHGPPGDDIDIILLGHNITRIKQAALSLAAELKQLNGVYNIRDDLPFGKEHIALSLTPLAHAAKLTVEQVGQQLQAGYHGALAQIFHQGDDEVEVRVMLPDAQRDNLSSLKTFPIIHDGKVNLLANIANFKHQLGFDEIKHVRAQPAIRVLAEVDNKTNNAFNLLTDLEQNFLPKLSKKYNVEYKLSGRAEEQAETFGDMKYGLLIGLTLIYIILAWIFASYTQPLLVMSIIPFGLIGAIFGHIVLQRDLTIISMFGFFGLSGIIINDSIILVRAYNELRAKGLAVKEAIIEASCLRLRAVMLTSVTTISGLLPLLFESSTQAQFLIPMAISICFGLAFATLLILVVLPCLLVSSHDLKTRLLKKI